MRLLFIMRRHADKSDGERNYKPLYVRVTHKIDQRVIVMEGKFGDRSVCKQTSRGCRREMCGKNESLDINSRSESRISFQIIQTFEKLSLYFAVNAMLCYNKQKCSVLFTENRF